MANMHPNTSGLRKGGPGRPKGLKEKLPRAPWKRARERLAAEKPELVYDALVESLASPHSRVGALALLARSEDIVDAPPPPAVPTIIIELHDAPLKRD